MVERATGANIAFHMKQETAYGILPTGNWRTQRCYEFALGLGQPLIKEQLLGAGRDASTPDRGAKDSAGQVVFPIDQRLIYDPLVGFFGAPISGPTAIGSRGYIEFLGNPSDNDTISLGGTTWTFVAAAPGATETLIGASLEATLNTLVTDLNGSADANISDATYTRLGDRLVISHDTADTSGDTFALTASITAGAKLSNATLAGGGFFQRVFHSAPSALPSFAAQMHNQDLTSGNPYARHLGVLFNSFTIERTRAGAAKLSCQLVAQDEIPAAASAAGTPSTLAVDVFSHFQGSILIDDRQVAAVTAATLNFSNNLDIVEALRDDGLIDGADPGEVSLGASLTARHTDNVLKQASEAETPVTARFGFLHRTDGAELLFELHELTLPRSAKPITGAGGISVTYESEGGTPTSPTRSATVTLINDVADYSL